MKTIVFGGGCFWCTEAVFTRLRGVSNVLPGYSNGHVANPTYEQVSSGQTGCAEVSKVEYDPEQIKLRDLLAVFFSSHDPTTLNRQGADVGTQYRSGVYFISDDQKKEILEYIAELEKDGVFQNAIVTEAEPLKDFSVAEDYHQKYYENNKNVPYCQFVIDPKIAKLKKQYSALLK